MPTKDPWLTGEVERTEDKVVTAGSQFKCMMGQKDEAVKTEGKGKEEW